VSIVMACPAAQAASNDARLVARGRRPQPLAGGLGRRRAERPMDRRKASARPMPAGALGLFIQRGHTGQAPRHQGCRTVGPISRKTAKGCVRAAGRAAPGPGQCGLPRDARPAALHAARQLKNSADFSDECVARLRSYPGTVPRVQVMSAPAMQMSGALRRFSARPCLQEQRSPRRLPPASRQPRPEEPALRPGRTGLQFAQMQRCP